MTRPASPQKLLLVWSLFPRFFSYFILYILDSIHFNASTTYYVFTYNLRSMTCFSSNSMNSTCVVVFFKRCQFVKKTLRCTLWCYWCSPYCTVALFMLIASHFLHIRHYYIALTTNFSREPLPTLYDCIIPVVSRIYCTRVPNLLLCQHRHLASLKQCETHFLLSRISRLHVKT